MRCRKCLKRSGLVRNSPERIACPECRGPAVRVSYRFQAPRRTDVAQWRKVAALLDQGFRFRPTAIRYPRTPAEVPAFEAWHRRRRLPHEP